MNKLLDDTLKGAKECTKWGIAIGVIGGAVLGVALAVGAGLGIASVIGTAVVGAAAFGVELGFKGMIAGAIIGAASSIVAPLLKDKVIEAKPHQDKVKPVPEHEKGSIVAADIAIEQDIASTKYRDAELASRSSGRMR